MKRLYLLVLLMACCRFAQAQDNTITNADGTTPEPGGENFYIDVAAGPRGFSGTYTRKMTPHFEMGGGACYYSLKTWKYNNHRAGAYLDLRPHWGAKKSMFFLFTDLGLAFNGGKQPVNATMSLLGMHIAFGPGYCYKINQRGYGVYVSMGIYGSTATLHETTAIPPKKSATIAEYDGYGVFSVGFKF